MQEITIQNQYYEYAITVEDDGKLSHRYFLPAGYKKKPKMPKLKRIYPYETVIAFKESKSMGWRFGDSVLWNEASDGLRFEAIRHEGEITVIQLCHPHLPVHVELYYQCRKDSPALQRWTKIVNTGNKAIELQHISSFVLCGFPYFGKSEDLSLHSYTSGWACEGDERIDSFANLGLLGEGCRSGWSFNNTSVFSSSRYFPYFVLEEKGAQLFWGVQIESGSQWRAEICGADVGNPDWFCFQGGLLNFLGAQWSKVLAPDEAFITPKVSMTVAEEEITRIYDQMHAHQRQCLIHQPESDRTLPVIFNDWQAMRGDTSQERIHAQLSALYEMGVEVYVTDAGWYTDPGQDWSEHVGCWKPSKIRFPSGLTPVAQDIRSHGMIPGIWCEIEMAGPHSPYYNDPNMVLTCNGGFITQGFRRFLDFRKNAVCEYASGVLAELYQSGFRYIKIDYNADCSPCCDGTDRNMVENLRQARLAYENWIASELVRFPDLILEHCASGGLKLDYSNLSRGSLGSITDMWNYRHTGGILWNVTKLVHPAQCENWSTLKPDMDRNTMEFTLTNSMMGRMCVSGVLSEFSKDKQQVVQQAVDFYKHWRELIQDPKIIYHTQSQSLQENRYCRIMEYHSKGRSMIWISACDWDESITVVPAVNPCRLADAFPSCLGIEIHEGEITVHPHGLYGRILVIE